MFRHDVYKWAAVAFIIIFQYALFRQYAIREIIWTLPAGFDQTVYLASAYDNFESFLTEGLHHGVRDALAARHATGVMLPVQSALLFYVLGADRLSALTLLFLYFAAAEIFLVYTVQWLTCSWALAFGAMGLLMATSSRHLVSGGLYDFRIDCIAASLYLIATCFVLRSEIFRSRPFSVAYAVTASLLVLFRFIAISYVLLFLITVGAAMAYAVVRSPAATEAHKRIPNLGIAALLTVLFTGPVLIHDRGDVFRYYSQHFGPLKEIRAAELGLGTPGATFMFYPTSLYRDHLGVVFFVCATGLLSGALVVRRRAARTAVEPNEFPPGHYVLIAFVATVVPFLLLMADSSKSPVVGGLLVGPLTLVVVLTARVIARQTHSTPLAIVSACIVLLGMGRELAFSSRHSAYSKMRTDISQLLSTYDELLQYADEARIRSARIAIDRIVDYLPALVYSVVGYEHTKTLHPASLVLGMTIDGLPAEAALKAVDSADIAFLTIAAPGHDAASVFPFDKQMASLRPALWSHASAGHLLFKKIQYGNHQIAVFVRPAVRVEGASGDWLTADGASLVMPCRLLTGKKSLIASGTTIFPEMIGNALGVNAQLKDESGGRLLRTTVSPVSATYSLTIDVTGSETTSGVCDISLAFDRYFVPKERGINADTRKLVIQEPTSFRFE